MSEATKSHQQSKFAQRYHQSIEAKRKKKAQHGLMYNLVLAGVGIALIVLLIYLLVTI